MFERLLSWLGSNPPMELCPVGTPRSPGWPKLRAKHLAEHPWCEVCGDRVGVVPHHKLPVHVCREMELMPDNLISLCPGCHQLVGHLNWWGAYNPEVDADVAIWREKIRCRPRMAAELYDGE